VLGIQNNEKTTIIIYIAPKYTARARRGE